MKKTRLRYALLKGSYWHNEKVCRRSLAALGLHSKALSYCADKMTDGKVPRWMIPALAGTENADQLVVELTTIQKNERRPMWIERNDIYEIVAYGEHNITTKAWEDKKKRDREAKRRQRSKNKEETEVSERSQVSGHAQGQEDVSADSILSQDDCSLKRLKTKEKEKEKNTKKEKSFLSESNDIRRVFDFWVSCFSNNKGPTPKLDRKRKARIQARLRERFTPDQLCRAIEGCSKNQWHLEKGYTGLETILRDAGTVEKHIAFDADNKNKHSKYKTLDELGADFERREAEAIEKAKQRLAAKGDEDAN